MQIKARKKGKKLPYIILIVLVAAVILGSIYGSMTAAVTLDKPVRVEIEEGVSTAKIAQTLTDAGVVKSAMGFKYYVKKMDAGEKLQSGIYEFSGKVSLRDVVTKLQTHSTLGDLKVTIPEGLTMRQTAERFAEVSENITFEDFLEYAKNGDFEYSYLPQKGAENRLEGFLFPETYLFSKNAQAAEVVDLMLAEFDENWTDAFQAQADKKKTSVYRAITMASLVEKEARIAADRPIIAGVFYNRLALDMPLQSCASIQYLLGEPKAKLLYSDLQIDSPYNTYLHKGLTPGPIASPGLSAIKAALYPEEHDYLYFLAKPDGSHVFNETYAGHQADKAKYID